MLNDAVLKVSPHESFKVTQLCESVAICEATKDPHNWGNATDTEPAFMVYLGCQKDEVAGYIKTFNTFYRTQWCEINFRVAVRKPKHLKEFEAEIKIRGMQRFSDSHTLGLNYLVESENIQAKNLKTPVKQSHIERTAEGRLILNYYLLDFAYPDSDGELTDEEGVYFEIRSLTLPFAENSPSHEEAENVLKVFFGSEIKLLGMVLREKIDLDGNIIWQHPCVGKEPEF